VGRENSFSSIDGVDGFVTLAQLGALPTTRSASTPNGGRHYWFRHIEGSRSRKLGAGIEWFSDKKLVVVPPAQGREWLNDADVVEAPDWLRELVLTPINDGCRGNSSGPLVATLIGQTSDGRVPRQIYLLIVRGMRGAAPKAQRRVKGLWANLAAKGQHRNDGLNYTAWQFREFVRSGDLDREIAAKLLWLACKANGYLVKDGPDVVKAVIHRVIENEQTKES
jgi:bifunctional DNA primase/polymerase-like protein